MLVKIEARILIFPGTDFHFPSTAVPPGTFFRLCFGVECIIHCRYASCTVVGLTQLVAVVLLCYQTRNAVATTTELSECRPNSITTVHSTRLTASFPERK